MPSCMVDSCCGCFELRTGCLIFGYFELVLEIIFVVVFSVLGIMVGAAVANTSDHSEYKSARINLFALCIINLVAALVFLAITFVLLVGVHMNKRNHVKAYLIVSVFCVFVTTASFFASFAGPPSTLGNILANVLVVRMSFILVIRSYYYKMEEPKPVVEYTA